MKTGTLSHPTTPRILAMQKHMVKLTSFTHPLPQVLCLLPICQNILLGRGAAQSRRQGVTLCLSPQLLSDLAKASAQTWSSGVARRLRLVGSCMACVPPGLEDLPNKDPAKADTDVGDLKASVAPDHLLATPPACM